MSGEDNPKPQPKPKEDKPAKADDVVFVHSPTEKGDGFRVVRKRADTIEVGEIRALEEGRPVHGDVVRLSPREEHAQLFDVDVVVPAPSPAEASRSGPPQVATDAYRRNWDAIFGAPPESSKLN
ncbi:MAG: hypothetical protein HUU21_27020 [Polyangiaceae bacterium]|nr:hypothetical protein [Polyangiaceae bacterium]NUQ77203.1 hypothetical protein [Polyangiaceae bacterium]